MGDISAEPSMEEILSSIKRIIAEEEPAGRRRPVRPTTTDLPAYADPDPDDEVLELSDPMPPANPKPRADRTAPEPVAAPVAEAVRVSEPDMPAPIADPILSRAAADATRGSLEALTRMMVKPEPSSDGTLEGLVREMLRPMLREWLDARLPAMVETMVAREIERISGQPR
jgi:hypothetical protein